MNFFNKVYGLCKEIPKGKVSTYKELANALNSKAYRLVGQALKRNPCAPETPCHRIVSSEGKLRGFNGKTSQDELDKKAELLKKEGIEVENNKILNFKSVLFKFK